MCWSIHHQAIGTLFVPNFNLSYISVLEAFRRWLEDSTPTKVGHNIYTYDSHMFANHGIRLRGVLGDTLRMSKMWSNMGEGHDLKHLMWTYLKLKGPGEFMDLFSHRTCLGVTPEGPLVETHRKVLDTLRVPTIVGGASSRVSWKTRDLIPLSKIPTDYPELLPTLVEYASLDAVATEGLYPVLAGKLSTRKTKTGNLMDVYTKVWNPYLDALTVMERNGAPVATERCRTLSGEARFIEADYKKELLLWHSGRFNGVNWHSSSQLGDVLFEQLKYERPPIMGSPKAIKRAPEGKYSTSEASLDWLWFRSDVETQEALKNIIGLRKARKYRNDYLEKLPEVAIDGRVHAVFAPSTDTGRLSCSKPPLQQIPAKDRFGIRSVFIAPPGQKLIVLDYSQLEVYVLAHILIKLFDDHSLANGLASGDVYSDMAKQVWPGKLQGIAPGAIKSHPDKGIAKLRDLAKIVVLAKMYGKTPEGLAISIRDDLGEAYGLPAAQALIDGINNVFPGMSRYETWAADFAAKHYGVPTLLGRWRPIPEAASERRWEREAGARKAANSPIQGTAAEIMACALTDCVGSGLEVTLNVHDELVILAPEDKAESVLAQAKYHMENPSHIELTVPLRAEAKIVDHWGAGK